MRAAPCLFTVAAAIAGSIGVAGPAHAVERLSVSGRVLLGPRLARTGEVVVAAWIEDPKTLVLVWLDSTGGVISREELALPEEDAEITDLAPVVRTDGTLSVFLLERGVRRLGYDVPLKRVIVRHIGVAADSSAGRTQPVVQVVAEAPDDGSGRAPATIVGAGLYTPSQWPAVVWRREGGDTADTELAIVRPGEVTSSEILGDSRIATAVAWREDGGALVAASDAGRPVVMDTAVEAQIDVPTPAALTGLVVDADGDWFAAGVDAGRRLFIVGEVENRAAQSYFHAVAPLVDAPADLADAGSLAGAPRLVRIGRGTAVLWTAQVGKVDQVRVRALDREGQPTGASFTALACKRGERMLAMDAAGVGANVAVVAMCASGGRADVRGAVVRVGAQGLAWRGYFGSLLPL